jgi:hypothetical protein
LIHGLRCPLTHDSSEAKLKDDGQTLVLNDRSVMTTDRHDDDHLISCICRTENERQATMC